MNWVRNSEDSILHHLACMVCWQIILWPCMKSIEHIAMFITGSVIRRDWPQMSTRTNDVILWPCMQTHACWSNRCSVQTHNHCNTSGTYVHTKIVYGPATSKRTENCSTCLSWCWLEDFPASHVWLLEGIQGFRSHLYQDWLLIQTLSVMVNDYISQPCSLIQSTELQPKSSRFVVHPRKSLYAFS